ncbi:hypothetical protein PYJP_06280 [Pyrofollis japonicus]|uniref:hypothetical protein n=1 Tax=Pyrofollis japonicus TaxID=3060460 RepID=UPI00295C017E|nr:hypothetical protein [Pyrofollis japonicus]BEP17276.1 hypothetical protein PYJP_06280 [Pyrofollis japonicus]
MVVDDEHFVYGIEESQARGETLLYQKALQSLASTLYMPWLPYRADKTIVNRTRMPLYRAILERFRANSSATSCQDLNILDAIFGEFFSLVKLLAISPASRTFYEELVESSARNALEVLGNDNVVSDIYRLLREMLKENSMVERLRKLYSFVSQGQWSTMLDQEQGALQVLRGLTSKCGGSVNLFLLYPVVHSTYYFVELTKYVINKVKSVGITLNAIWLVYPHVSASAIRDIENRLHRELASPNKLSYQLRKREDAGEVAEEIVEIVPENECSVLVIVLDLAKPLIVELLKKLAGLKKAAVLMSVAPCIKLQQNQQNQLSGKPGQCLLNIFDTGYTV